MRPPYPAYSRDPFRGRPDPVCEIGRNSDLVSSQHGEPRGIDESRTPPANARTNFDATPDTLEDVLADDVSQGDLGGLGPFADSPAEFRWGDEVPAYDALARNEPPTPQLLDPADPDKGNVHRVEEKPRRAKRETNEGETEPRFPTRESTVGCRSAGLTWRHTSRLGNKRQKRKRWNLPASYQKRASSTRQLH